MSTARRLTPKICLFCRHSSRLNPALRTRYFSTKPVLRQEISSALLPRLKSLRQKWQDTLPVGLLSSSELRVWNTLYGEPRRWWSVDEAGEIEGLLKEGMLFEEAVILIDGVGEKEGGYVVEDGVVSYRGPVDGDGRPVKVDESVKEEFEEEAVVAKEVDEEEGRVQALRDARAAVAEITEVLDGGEKDEEGYVRTHPLTMRGRFATYPSTVFVPRTLQSTTVSLLRDVKMEHLRERAYLYNPPPVRAPTGAGTIKGLSKGKSGYHPNLSPETHRGDKLDAAVWLGLVLPEVYAVNLGVATEIRRRLGGDWARGVKKVLDVGGGGAGILAWGDIVKAENMAVEERRLEEDSTELEGEEMVTDGTWDWGHGVEGVKAASLDEDFEFEATVVTASPHVRGLAAKVLANTTFLPRVPYFSAVHGNVRWDDSGFVKDEEMGEVTWHPPPPEADVETKNDKKQPPVSPKRTYDLIFASYTLEHIKKENLFQHHIDNLWQLLNPGGVLCLIELGNIDGFNNIASARQRLLRKWIKSPLSTKPKAETSEEEVDDISAPVEEDILNLSPQKPKEKETPLEDGMIVAPCTNHTECPMHNNTRTIFKSADICKFPQKYQRTTIAQRVVSGHTDHTNAFFSYISVRRGVSKDTSLSTPQETAKRRREEEGRKPKLLPMPLDKLNSQFSTDEKRGFMHLQPRLILPPIKGDHHVTLDVCTSHGDLERWIVPNSFSKRAYTDARKARWGDLWVWGAKTKVVRESKKTVIERERLGREEREKEKGGVVILKSKGKKEGRKGWDAGRGAKLEKKVGRKVNRVPFKKLAKSVEGYTREKGRKEAAGEVE
ncbi:37S ribosomal protein S22 [Arthrobotrys musiformis]|uniref:37S ribosomal protein S22 n=1 Tax=Arthrobotrys musiformis TaxID=47236 RepID=A0AAV9VUW9_9PEZI